MAAAFSKDLQVEDWELQHFADALQVESTHVDEFFAWEEHQCGSKNFQKLILVLVCRMQLQCNVFEQECY